MFDDCWFRTYDRESKSLALKVDAMPHRNRDSDVVVTGMGAVTPLGTGVDALWLGVRKGRSGVDWIEPLFDVGPSDSKAHFAAAVKDFAVEQHLRQHTDVREEKSVQMGLVAACQALNQSGLLDSSEKLTDPGIQIATIVGSGHGPAHEAEKGYASFFLRNPRAVRPTTIPKSMFNSLSSNISIHFGLHGTNLVIASACASSSAAIGLASLLIRQGWTDIVLAGGAEAPLTPVSFASWVSLRTLAQHPEPQRACRPFDRNRNGMVLGEAAAMVVLERRDHAERRGSVPLANVRGFGASSDAHHITAPSVAGQRMAIHAALVDAEIAPHQIGYINAHGTATKANDESEAKAVVEIFGPRGSSCPMSSTKSMLGHSLGATGAVEFIICVEVLRNSYVPPTINCEDPDPDIGLDYTPHVGRPHNVQFVMSNSFAFGGNNASIILEREQ